MILMEFTTVPHPIFFFLIEIFPFLELHSVIYIYLLALACFHALWDHLYHCSAYSGIFEF